MMLNNLRNIIILGTLILCLPVNAAVTRLVINEIGSRESKIISSEDIISLGGIRPGMIYTPESINNTNRKIIEELQTQGYLFGRIDSVSLSYPDSNLVNLTWHIYDGLTVLIGNINIASDTLDTEIIRRQMDIKEGDIYNEAIIEQELLRVNRFFAQNGRPFAELIIKNALLVKGEDDFIIDLDLEIQSGQDVRINRFQLKGNSVTKDNVILRELEVKIGDQYDQDIIDRIPQTLNRLGYFRNVSNPRLVYSGDDQNVLLIEVEEGNTTTFDGVVGYIPPSQQVGGEDGYFTGLIDLSFRNLFGTGRKFEVNWKKQDRYSDEFRLYYEEPWIFGYPLNLGGGLYRLVRDTTYIERSYSINGTFRLTSDFSTSFSVLQKSFTPDSLASRQMRLAENDVLTGEIGIEYDTRDYPVNPRRGLLYDTYYSFGFKDNQGPDYLFEEDGLARREELQKIRVGLSFFQTLWSNQVFALKFFGGRVQGNQNQLQITDHFWFGGARTLRGYREDQFHGTTISWINLEYRFLTGRESRVYIFNDWGFYNYELDDVISEDILPGYGIGVRFMTPLGIMSVDFGLGKGDSFSTGKIHVGVVNSF